MLRSVGLPGATAFGLAVIGLWSSLAGPARAASDEPAPAISKPVPVKLNAIPPEADIVFHADGQIYVMDRNGGHVTQITTGEPRQLAGGHVAVSFGRNFIVAGEPVPRTGDHRVKLWLFDLRAQTEAQLVPSFDTAGNGGVDWDPSGFIYFAGREKPVVSSIRSPNDLATDDRAVDVYRVRYDGTGLRRLTNTPDGGEYDVAVSDDGTLVAFAKTVPDPEQGRRDAYSGHTEIWVMNADGSNQRRVLTAGRLRSGAAYDPDISPDNRFVVFSRENSDVPPNWPDDPIANTAHDLWRIDISGDASTLTRLTDPGPISIIPNWQGSSILYFEHVDGRGIAPDYHGASRIAVEGGSGSKVRLRNDIQMPNWIPPR